MGVVHDMVVQGGRQGHHRGLVRASGHLSFIKISKVEEAVEFKPVPCPVGGSPRRVWSRGRRRRSAGRSSGRREETSGPTRAGRPALGRGRREACHGGFNYYFF